MGEYSIAEALKQFMDESRLKGSIQAIQIEEAWEKIMGKTCARHTDKLQVIGDTLFVTTTVAPLKQELNYQKDKIIERVNEVLGKQVIKKIVIK